MNVTYRVTLRGCDDRTVMLLQLSEEEVAFLRRLAEASVQTSTYGCMPTLQIVEAGELCAACQHPKEQHIEPEYCCGHDGDGYCECPAYVHESKTNP
jgi:hypothetical protein